VVNTYKVTASSLNIRKSAGVDGAKVGSYKKDTVVTVLETKKVGSTTWAKTDKGWVSMEYLTLVETGGNNTQQPDIQQPDTQQPAANTYQVTASSLNIRKSASSSANKIGSYKKGTVVTVLETKKVGSTTWAKTDKGWVSMEYLTPVKTGSSDTQQPDNLQTQGKTYTVTASRLNVRKSASSSAKVVDCYEKGTKVTVLETKKVGSVTWGRTSKGWISMQYVK
jgi:N-acetylmuramoyl-L-alanine amidase